jgi:hypothetical protein
MTLSEFSKVFALLALQLRDTDADEATIRGYFEALKDLESEFLQMAATRLAKNAKWFPKTSEWRALTLKIEAERIDQQRAVRRDLPEHLCLSCDDTGWELVEGRVRPCDCAKLRRLEVLGRKSLPALPPGKPGHHDETNELLSPHQSEAAFAEIKRRGFTIGLRVMPNRHHPGREKPGAGSGAASDEHQDVEGGGE